MQQFINFITIHIQDLWIFSSWTWTEEIKCWIESERENEEFLKPTNAINFNWLLATYGTFRRIHEPFSAQIHNFVINMRTNNCCLELTQFSFNTMCVLKHFYIKKTFQTRHQNLSGTNAGLSNVRTQVVSLFKQHTNRHKLNTFIPLQNFCLTLYYIFLLPSTQTLLVSIVKCMYDLA